jgi:glucan phosphoethanolaminetransferase (alkaline phosphatase superfamily)
MMVLTMQDKIKLKDFIESVMVGFVYLFAALLSAILVVYLINRIYPLDLTNVGAINIALVILATYFVIDFSLLYVKKPNFTMIVLLAIVAPFALVYKLFCNFDLMSSVGPETPDEISSYVFMKKVFN